MSKLILKSVLSVGLLIFIIGCPFWVTASPNISQAEESLLKNKQTHMHLTHTLSSAIIYSYFREGDAKYRPQYLAHKQYLVAFLNKWAELIESDKFNTSTEIFNYIKSSNNYLGQYFHLWETLTTITGQPEINLGYTKNGSLYIAIKNENLPMETRILKLLDDVNVSISGSSHDYELAAVLAYSFVNSESKEIREKANGILKSKNLHHTVEVLAIMRDLWVGAKGTGLTNFLPSLSKTASTIGNSSAKASTSAKTYLASMAQELKNPNFLKITSVNSLDRLFEGIGRLGLSPFVYSGRMVNPFLQKLSVMQKMVGASAALHAGVFYATSGSASKDTKNTEAVIKKDSLFESILMLWENITQVYARDSLHSNTDLPSRFTTQTIQELSTRVLEALTSGKNIDYLDIFLKAEKLQNIDKRELSDLLAMNFGYGKIQDKRIRIKNQFENKTLNTDAIDDIRGMLIDEELKSYKRDHPSLTSVFLGWGGNCVSQTMLMTGIFKPLENRILKDSGFKLGLVLMPGHVEAVFYNDLRVLFSISGQDVPRNGRTIYKPELLLLAVLKNLGVETNLQEKDFLVGTSLPAITKVVMLDTNTDTLSKFWTDTKNFFDFSKEKPREGVVEALNTFALNTGWSDSASPETPESGTLSFSKFKAQEEYIAPSPGNLNLTAPDSSQLDEEKKPLKFTVIFEKLPKYTPYNARQNLLGHIANYSAIFYNVILTAYDEETYLYFLSLEKRFESSLKKAEFDQEFTNFKSSREQKLIDQHEVSSDYHRIFVKPSEDLTNVLNLEDDDLDKFYALLEIVYQKRSYDPSSKIGFNFRKLLEKIAADPLYYINIYNKANVEQKTYLTYFLNIFRPVSYYNGQDQRAFLHLYTPFSKSVENRGQGIGTFIKTEDESLLQNARDAIGNYLRSLTAVKINHSSDICNLAYSKIKLPTTEQATPLLIQVDPTQDVNTNCNRKIKKDHKLDPSTSGVQLTTASLIELTVMFKAGLHLWDETSAQAFIDQKYWIRDSIEEIFYWAITHDRRTGSRDIVYRLIDIKSIKLQLETSDVITPAMQKISATIDELAVNAKPKCSDGDIFSAKESRCVYADRNR